MASPWEVPKDCLDTEALSDQHVELRGFQGLWESFSPVNVSHAILRVDSALHMVHTYTLFANDLAKIKRKEDGNPLFELLSYHLEGARRTLKAAGSKPRKKPKNKMKETIETSTKEAPKQSESKPLNGARDEEDAHTKQETLSAKKEELDKAIGMFAGKMDTVKGLRGYETPSYVDERGNPKLFSIPNRSSVELLIKAYFEKKNYRPLRAENGHDPEAFVESLYKLFSIHTIRSRPSTDDVIWQTGLPQVLTFNSTFHHPSDPTRALLICTPSQDAWPWDCMRKTTNIWRDRRMKQGETREGIFTNGAMAMKKFAQVKEEQSDRNPRFKSLSKVKPYDKHLLNLTFELVYEDSTKPNGLPAITWKSRFDQRLEHVRSRYGRGSQMIGIHPRCGKCRITLILDWTVEEGDDPQFTSFNANPPGICAEDLTHYEVIELGLVAQLPKDSLCEICRWEEAKLFPDVESFGGLALGS